MFFPPLHRFSFRATTLFLILLCPMLAAAQVDDITGGEVDPIKLFERGQNAHAKGDVKTALALYEEAIKLRPEFPEAEFQRGVALVALQRPAEAEKPFRRAIELKKNWSLPYSALGDLLSGQHRDAEAEPVLRKALQLGASDLATLLSLSAIRFRAGDREDALSLARRATENENATASAWAWRGGIERTSGNTAAAMTSLNRALQMTPSYIPALQERAELYAGASDYDHAIQDLQAALIEKPGDKETSLRLAKFYELAGKSAEARKLYEAFGEVAVPQASPANGVTNVAGTPEDIAAANSDDAKAARPALEKLIAENPKNAALLARLGEVTRLSDPAKSLECYAAANKLDPSNHRYAIGFAAALVQSRRFAEAVQILRRVVSAVPDNHAAHANLAIALYELKQYAQALPEYEWLAQEQPDRASTYFYIAIARDNLGQYPQALEAYEKFLALADPAKARLEIDKVNLRLPRLRDQIKRGQGVKPGKR